MSEIFRVRRHRITIERKIALFGWWKWVAVCTTWAQIASDVITIRYQRDLLPGMRVVIGNSHFEITAVIDRPGKTRLVELHIKEFRASADLPDALWW